MSGPAATMAAASSPRALPCAAGRRSTQNVATSTTTAMSSVMTRAAGGGLATVPRNVPGSSSLATVPPGEWFSNSPVPAEGTGAALNTKSGRYRDQLVPRARRQDRLEDPRPGLGSGALGARDRQAGRGGEVVRVVAGGEPGRRGHVVDREVLGQGAGGQRQEDGTQRVERGARD